MHQAKETPIRRPLEWGDEGRANLAELQELNVIHSGAPMVGPPWSCELSRNLQQSLGYHSGFPPPSLAPTGEFCQQAAAPVSFHSLCSPVSPKLEAPVCPSASKNRCSLSSLSSILLGVRTDWRFPSSSYAEVETGSPLMAVQRKPGKCTPTGVAGRPRALEERKCGALSQHTAPRRAVLQTQSDIKEVFIGLIHHGNKTQRSEEDLGD